MNEKERERRERAVHRAGNSKKRKKKQARFRRCAWVGFELSVPPQSAVDVDSPCRDEGGGIRRAEPEKERRKRRNIRPFGGSSVAAAAAVSAVVLLHLFLFLCLFRHALWRSFCDASTLGGSIATPALCLSLETERIGRGSTRSCSYCCCSLCSDCFFFYFQPLGGLEEMAAAPAAPCLSSLSSPFQPRDRGSIRSARWPKGKTRRTSLRAVIPTSIGLFLREGRKKGGEREPSDFFFFKKNLFLSTSPKKPRPHPFLTPKKKKKKNRTPPSTRSSSASSTPAPAGPAAPSPSPRPRFAPSASPRARS